MLLLFCVLARSIAIDVRTCDGAQKGSSMNVATFAEIQAEFLARVTQAVYCTMATVDQQNRPRSRIMHPIWEGPIGPDRGRPDRLDYFVARLAQG